MSDVSKEVAVKQLKNGASANFVRAAMSELKVMLFIKSHENIVKFIGACTRDLIYRVLLNIIRF